ncbi:hypothetical protein H4I95_05962 [Botrytis cinerea]
MARTLPSLSAKDDKKPKLPRIGKNQRIQKRPLLHPAIASPRSSSEKVVYVSDKSQFIAIVKRVRKYLDGAEFRAGPTVLPSTDRELMREIEEGIKTSRMERKSGSGNGEEVQQEGVRVVVRTKSVATVDDIVGIDNKDDDMEESESRVRRVSVLEVAVSYI